MQWTASPPAKTARPKGGGKDAAPKVLRVEALTPRQVAEVAAGVDAEKLRLEELKRRRSEARAAAAEAAEGQSAEEAEAAQLRSLLHDDDAPSDLAADYGGEAYDAAEAEGSRRCARPRSARATRRRRTVWPTRTARPPSSSSSS